MKLLLITAASALALIYAAPAMADIPTVEDVLGEPDEQVLMQADNLSYDGSTGIVSATGHVEANYSGRILMADQVTYNEVTGEVIAIGNVSITQPTGEVLFADYVQLTDELGEGIVENLRFLLANDAQLAATRGTRTGGTRTELEQAVFSPCEECERIGERLWQITAFRVTHDQERQRIVYRDARFEIFGVPVAYFPYLAHPDPSVERQSGFLAPGIGNTTELGNWVEVPYYFALAPNYDLTIAPMITTSEGVVVKSEFRHRVHAGEYELDGSVTFAARRNDDNKELSGHTFRGHLFADGAFEFAENWEWGFDLELVSDDTYLKRYDISNRDRLTNNLFARRISGRDYTSFDSYYFIGLREEDDEGQTPIVPALFEHREIIDRRYFGGQVGFNVNSLVLARTEGADTARISAELTWDRTHVSDLGQVYSLFLSNRTDLYYVRNVAETPGRPDGDEVVMRALPLAAVEWSWPFVRQNGSVRQIIEPIVQVVATPYGGNPSDIPNEDSASFEFDETNLFSYNKFPGLDRWEEGPRVNAGVRLAAQTIGGGSGSIVLGQSYRFRDDPTFEQGSGLESERSDFVGRIDLRPGRYLDLIHRFRLDRDDLHFRRNEVALLAGTEDYNLEVGYVALEDVLIPNPEPDPNLFLGPGFGPIPYDEEILGDREEINVKSHISITNNWAFEAGARRNLEDNIMISSFAGLVYHDRCTDLEISYRRRFTRDRDIEPSTAIMLQVRLHSLGH